MCKYDGRGFIFFLPLRNGLTAPGWRMCLSQVLCHPGNHGDHDDRLDAIWSQPHKKKKKKAADGNQATRPVSRETRRKRERGERRYCGRLMPREESTEAVLEMNILEKSGNRNRKQGRQESGKEETQCKKEAASNCAIYLHSEWRRESKPALSPLFPWVCRSQNALESGP